MIFNLVDGSFSHDISAVAGVDSRDIEWDREWTDPTRPVFVTNEAVLRPLPSGLTPAAKYGWLIESAAIIPSVYRRAFRVVDKYDLFFTHSTRLLEKKPKCRWIPGGGIWIGGQHAGGSMGVFPKTRLCSMLTSSKTTTRLHRTRLAVAKELAAKRSSSIDVFIDPDRPYSFEALRDYRYNICIENNIDDSYFTERLLNCFATGTIPIYLGAPRLAEFFDMDGVLMFRNRRELMRILSQISADDYEHRLPAIHTNFTLAMQYRSIEDFIASRYLAN
jgi:Glycosyltransferase family 10 (fucosyltransferase) C-term